MRTSAGRALQNIVKQVSGTLCNEDFPLTPTRERSTSATCVLRSACLLPASPPKATSAMPSEIVACARNVNVGPRAGLIVVLGKTERVGWLVDVAVRFVTCLKGLCYS